MFKYLTSNLPRSFSKLPLGNNIIINSYTNTYTQFNTFNTLSYKSFAMEIPVYASQFEPRGSGKNKLKYIFLEKLKILKF
jgi:hypothetical protein